MIRCHVLFRGLNNQIGFDLCQLAGLMPLLWIRQLGFESLSPSLVPAIRVQCYAVVKVRPICWSALKAERFGEWLRLRISYAITCWPAR